MRILAFAPVAGHHILTWIIIGLVAGVLASRVVRGTGLGFVRDVIVGLAGAVVGGLLLHVFRGGPHTSPSIAWEIVIALVGAIVLLVVVKALHHGRHHGSRRSTLWR